MSEWWPASNRNPGRLQIGISGRIKSEFADETTLPTLEPGAGKAKKPIYGPMRETYDRPFGGGDDPPMVAYRFEDSRSGDALCDISRAITAYFKWRLRRLSAAGEARPRGEGFAAGLLLGASASKILRTACRRQLQPGHRHGPADEGSLVVEDQVRGLTPDHRSTARRQSSAPIVAELFALWEKELVLISGNPCSSNTSATPWSAGPASNCSSQTAASRWTPISSSGQSGPDQYQKECALRRFRRWWPDVGDRGDPADHRNDDSSILSAGSSRPSNASRKAGRTATSRRSCPGLCR